MDLNPPVGSEISISHDGVEPTIIIPAKRNASRYFGGEFLVCWLGLWTMGFKSAASELMAGKAAPFLIFWLAAWTIGGFFAALTAYRIFRPSAPETLQLKRGSIAYDSGTPPPEFNNYGRNKSRQDAWKSLFARRTRADLDRQELQTLRLRETDTGNRLTIDMGANRLELASQASEFEREWLARLLAKRYGLTQVLSDNAS